MTTNKFYEFGWIHVDQWLDFVFESRAIFCGMPFNSFVVLTPGINIVSFRIWRSSWSFRNDKNLIVLDQYGEQFSIGHRKCMVHFGPFPFLALVIAWVGLLIVFLCEPLGRMKTGQGDLGIPAERGWFLTGSSRVVCNLLLLPLSFLDIAWTCSSGTILFFSLMLAPLSTILPLFIPSSILPTEYIKSLNPMKVLTISMS